MTCGTPCFGTWACHLVAHTKAFWVIDVAHSDAAGAINEGTLGAARARMRPRKDHGRSPAQAIEVYDAC